MTTICHCSLLTHYLCSETEFLCVAITPGSVCLSCLKSLCSIRGCLPVYWLCHLNQKITSNRLIKIVPWIIRGSSTSVLGCRKQWGWLMASSVWVYPESCAVMDIWMRLWHPVFYLHPNEYLLWLTVRFQHILSGQQAYTANDKFIWMNFCYLKRKRDENMKGEYGHSDCEPSSEQDTVYIWVNTAPVVF